MSHSQPLALGGKLLNLKYWVPGSELLPVSDTIQKWVRLKGIPSHCWSRDIIFSLTKAIGTPLKLDGFTASQRFLSYARVFVELDPHSPLPPEIKADFEGSGPTTIEVSYENLPCRSCFKTGHGSAVCPTRRRGQDPLSAAGPPILPLPISPLHPPILTSTTPTPQTPHVKPGHSENPSILLPSQPMLVLSPVPLPSIPLSPNKEAADSNSDSILSLVASSLPSNQGTFNQLHLHNPFTVLEESVLEKPNPSPNKNPLLTPHPLDHSSPPPSADAGVPKSASPNLDVSSAHHLKTAPEPCNLNSVEPYQSSSSFSSSNSSPSTSLQTHILTPSTTDPPLTSPKAIASGSRNKKVRKAPAPIPSGPLTRRHTGSSKPPPHQ